MSVATIHRLSWIMHDTGQPETRLMSDYDKTKLSLLASCEIQLTDLEILSELKTGTQH